MRLSSVREGDVVKVDVRGTVFHALVKELDGGQLQIRSLERIGATYRTATARQVVAHWRRSKS